MIKRTLKEICCWIFAALFVWAYIWLIMELIHWMSIGILSILLMLFMWI